MTNNFKQNLQVVSPALYLLLRGQFVNFLMYLYCKEIHENPTFIYKLYNIYRFLLAIFFVIVLIDKNPNIFYNILHTLSELYVNEIKPLLLQEEIYKKFSWVKIEEGNPKQW